MESKEIYTTEYLRELIVGKTIADVVDGQDTLQLDFKLIFSDGTALDVHAVGDDATYIEVELESQS